MLAIDNNITEMGDCMLNRTGRSQISTTVLQLSGVLGKLYIKHFGVPLCHVAATFEVFRQSRVLVLVYGVLAWSKVRYSYTAFALYLGM